MAVQVGVALTNTPCELTLPEGNRGAIENSQPEDQSNSGDRKSRAKQKLYFDQVVISNRDNNGKPTKTYVELVTEVLAESEGGEMQPGDIYEAIEAKYSYYRNMSEKSKRTWMSSIRHALIHPTFKSRPGTMDNSRRKRGKIWSLNENYDKTKPTSPKKGSTQTRKRKGEPLQDLNLSALRKNSSHSAKQFHPPSNGEQQENQSYPGYLSSYSAPVQYSSAPGFPVHPTCQGMPYNTQGYMPSNYPFGASTLPNFSSSFLERPLMYPVNSNPVQCSQNTVMAILSPQQKAAMQSDVMSQPGMRSAPLQYPPMPAPSHESLVRDVQLQLDRINAAASQQKQLVEPQPLNIPVASIPDQQIVVPVSIQQSPNLNLENSLPVDRDDPQPASGEDGQNPALPGTAAPSGENVDLYASESEDSIQGSDDDAKSSQNSEVSDVITYQGTPMTAAATSENSRESGVINNNNHNNLGPNIPLVQRRIAVPPGTEGNKPTIVQVLHYSPDMINGLSGVNLPPAPNSRCACCVMYYTPPVKRPEMNYQQEDYREQDNAVVPEGQMKVERQDKDGKRDLRKIINKSLDLNVSGSSETGSGDAEDWATEWTSFMTQSMVGAMEQPSAALMDPSPAIVPPADNLQPQEPNN